jgi:crotonobetainyl-CoA:carnitine CoA-transferase CaiB-like acyl-CoA transferase
MGYDAPFAGLKVVDLSQGIAGPYCTMLLAQYGANVIKVEPVGDGDWARTLGTRYGDHTAFSIIGNLGKRSVALDLKQDAGRGVLKRLIAGADVFVEGFRPGVIGRLGFGYEDVAASEPRLIYVSISGFGQTGPLAERPAMDPILQAYTGLMMENSGDDGIPHRVPVIPVDMSTALYAFQALSAALYGRRDESRGRFIDVSLMQGATALQSVRLMACHLEGGTMRPGGVPSGVFRTTDGFMSITAFRDEEWSKLCDIIEMPHLASDARFVDMAARFDNEAALYRLIRPAIAARPTAVLAERLTRARLMHERLNTYAAFLEEEHVKATNLIRWSTQPGVPRPVPMPALPGVALAADGSPKAISPTHGRDTAAVLREHGYGKDEIERLKAAGAVVIG